MQQQTAPLNVFQRCCFLYAAVAERVKVKRILGDDTAAASGDCDPADAPGEIPADGEILKILAAVAFIAEGSASEPPVADGNAEPERVVGVVGILPVEQNLPHPDDAARTSFFDGTTVNFPCFRMQAMKLAAEGSAMTCSMCRFPASASSAA